MLRFLFLTTLIGLFLCVANALKFWAMIAAKGWQGCLTCITREQTPKDIKHVTPWRWKLQLTPLVLNKQFIWLMPVLKRIVTLKNGERVIEMHFPWHI